MNYPRENRKHSSDDILNIAVLGSGIYYSDQICKYIETEFQIHCRRLDESYGIQHVLDQWSGTLQLIILDQQHADELLKRDDAFFKGIGSTVIALAYRDVSVAQDFLRQWKRRAGRNLGFLPMNIPVDVWLAMLRLLLHGNFVIPAELLSSGQDTAATAEDTGGTGNARGKVVPVDCFSHLTSRESDVLELIVEGKSNKCIAAELAITEHTVKLHVHNLTKKLGVTNRTAAVSLYYSAAQKRLSV